MDRMVRVLVSAAWLLLAAAPAWAQGTATSALSGVVSDGSGGAVPGATVVVKNNATSVTFQTVTNTTGQFSFPALAAATYTVTVSLSGFKTFVASDVRLLAGRPGGVNAKLEVGNLTETVSVKAGTERVQSQTNAVSSTLSVEQLSGLPLITRNALYAVALPGVATTGGPRGAIINGLPNNTVNVTIDGISTGNMLQSTDGFFSMLTPRMDAVEEVTMTGAVPGSGGGAGSVQVGFVTRSGSNRFDGSVYHYYRSPALNTNYYFNKVNNLDKNDVLVHQYGGRLGGPVVLPGFDGRGKAFFFFNYERQYQPQEQTRTRTMLRDSAMNGIFAWDVTVAGVTTQSSRDLMALAAANGQIATFDPTIRGLLAKIRTGAQSTGTINDVASANTLQYVFQSPGKSNQYSPTSRVDVNVTPNQRLTGSYWLQRFATDPDLLNNRDPIFPANNSATQRRGAIPDPVSLRSTLSSSIVNELRGGFQTSPSTGFVTLDQFDDGRAELPGQHRERRDPRSRRRRAIPPPGAWRTRSTGPRRARSPSADRRRAAMSDRHTVATNIVPASTRRMTRRSAVPQHQLPSVVGEPDRARNIYALLTGRVTQIPGQGRLNARQAND
jgi:hypothetical protein